jgi:hypothetical protein
MTWLARQFVTNAPPLQQLLVCGAVGFVSGVVFVYFYGPSRRAALDMVSGLAELKKRRRENGAEA